MTDERTWDEEGPDREVERQLAATNQRRREDDRIAAMFLTPKDEAALALAIERGWSERSWLLTLADDRDRRAEADAKWTSREQAESVEAIEASWAGTFAADPFGDVRYAQEPGQFGRRFMGEAS